MKKFLVFGLIFIMVTCIGCNDKDNGNEPVNNESSEETANENSGNIENNDSTDNIENTQAQTAPAPTQKLKPPRTQKEFEDAFGTVDEQGKWTPPEGSYIDPQTGNILNKDGVVVGTTQEPYTKARPGSKG